VAGRAEIKRMVTASSVGRERYAPPSFGLYRAIARKTARINGLMMGALVIGVSVLAVGNSSAEELFYVHADHLGTPNLVTDDNQDTVWEAQALPFGAAQVVNDRIEMNVRYPGQYYDTETGLHYNVMRYYHPGLGRYLQSDPIGLDGGINTYGYAGQNPIMAYDPTGEFFWFLLAGAGTGTAITGAEIFIWSLLGLGAVYATAHDLSNVLERSESSEEDCDDECDKLNKEVQNAKNEVGKLGKCVAGMSKWELETRRQAWLRQAQARSHRDSKCWGGGDEGHQQAQADSWRHVGICTALLDGI
jgi:RHS repeat-associated protein